MGNTIARADCANADGKEVCRERKVARGLSGLLA